MGYGPNRFPYGYAPPGPRFPGNYGGNNFCADEPGVPGEDQPQQPPLPPGEGQDQGETGVEGNGQPQSQQPQPLMNNHGWNQPPNNFFMGQRMPGGFNPVPPQVSGKKKKKKNKQAQEQKLAAQASNCPDSIPLPSELQQQQPSTSSNAKKPAAG